MAKVGDTVRFLNTTGGGRITRIEGKIVYVEEDGFETPVLMNEIVVVMPAGHQPEVSGSKLMFDQKAFDKGREEPAPAPAPVKPAEPEPLPVEETAHGDKMNVVLAFEPRDIRWLSTTSFNALLINDSNYYLDYSLMRRADGERGWTVASNGTLAPNELFEFDSYSHESLGEIERIAFQCIARKKDKTFEMKAPVSVSRRLDLTKFHKLHCFRPGIYFDTQVLEIPLVKDDVPVKPLEVSEAGIAESMKTGAKSDVKGLKELTDKYRKDNGRKRNRREDPASNPHKLLPLIEVDLHIGELTDSLSGMEPKDMLEMQLAEVRKTMKAHSSRIGQKIVFIHGKGEGVLRNEVLKLLRKEYPKAELQDASFREYGFGATLVTVH